MESDKTLFCPNCLNSPYISLVSFKEHVPQIKIDCKQCRYNREMSLNSYLKILEENKEKKFYCNLNKEHSEKEAIIYCPDCESFQCKDCAETHKGLEKKFQKEHKTIKPNSCRTCEIHNGGNFIAYCLNCDKHLCKMCNIKKHQNEEKKDKSKGENNVIFFSKKISQEENSTFDIFTFLANEDNPEIYNINDLNNNYLTIKKKIDKSISEIDELKEILATILLKLDELKGQFNAKKDEIEKFKNLLYRNFTITNPNYFQMLNVIKFISSIELSKDFDSIQQNIKNETNNFKKSFLNNEQIFDLFEIKGDFDSKKLHKLLGDDIKKDYKYDAINIEKLYKNSKNSVDEKKEEENIICKIPKKT